MDVWLDSQGLYRKNTALDGTCLFRAVADQLFTYHVPNGHVVLREECVKFMRENRHLFESKVISGPFDEYLDNLSDLKQWAGQLELEALSLIYGVDFLVFKSIDLAPIPATQNGFERKIMLCFTPDNFYDAVYPKSYIENAGFCQSIVYGILYRGVFKLEDLEYAVEKMLHDKSARARREKYLNSQSQGREDTMLDVYLEESNANVNVKELLDKGAILFPYKVAKALDEDIYRNIDFDNWVDTLRVPRRNSFCFGNGGPLRVGVKCLLKLDDKTHTAHVQEMSPNNGPVVVFVEDIGEKLTVPYDSLEPLPRTSLKPEWTFSHKHQIINKFRELSIHDEGSKGKQGKNKGKKNKFMGMIEKRKPDQAGTLELVEQNRQPSGNGKMDEAGKSSGSGSIVLAEPDSTTTSYAVSPVASPTQMYYGSNYMYSPYAWTSASPQPQVVKTVNLSVNKSVKHDYSDLPLNDLETLRFFFNMGIDFFRMGSLMLTSPPVPDENGIPRMPVQTNGPRAFPKTSDESPKLKNGKNMKKAPRFLKMEGVETGDKPRNNSIGEPVNYPNEFVPEQPQYQPQPQSPLILTGLQQTPTLPPTQAQQAQGPIATAQIPMTIPYVPQYTVSYQVPNAGYPVQPACPVPGYPVQPMGEPMPVEPQPIPTVGYPEHQYVEPSYSVPYVMCTQTPYYYTN